MLLTRIVQLDEEVTQYNGHDTILFWTPFFSDKNWSGLLVENYSCGCYLTDDRRMLKHSQRVVFHWRDLSVNDFPPKYKNQKWVWFLLESPEYTHKKTVLNSVQRHIDCTATYRLDSDFYHPYGCSHNLPVNYQNTVNSCRKRRSVAWLVSACSTASQREKYVEELAKYIDVDIYGKCGQDCDDKPIPCHQHLEENYLFYLSFENSICKDYLTEKIYKILPLNMVPVVLGGADYERLLPNNSFINAAKFKSPKELALYLHKVKGDEKLCKSYFTWKSNYVKNTSLCPNTACSICKAAKSNTKCRSFNSSLVKWWYDEANCITWSQMS